MAKTQEELNALKENFEILREKLSELSDEELAQVTGGGTNSGKERVPMIGASVSIWDIAVKLKEKYNNSSSEIFGAEKQEPGGKNR